VGKRIRAARSDAGLSQEKLAEAVGVERRTLGMIEHGTSDPSFSVLLRIAHELRIPFDDLTRA
jgi:transcriptional regulator with XRE-family HTH domain